MLRLIFLFILLSELAMNALSADEVEEATLHPYEPPIPTYIQVGAYSSRENAEKVKKRIQTELNEKALISLMITADVMQYRVRVIPKNNDTDGLMLMNKLRKIGYKQVYRINE